MLLLSYFDETYLPQRMLGCRVDSAQKYRLTIGQFSRFLGHDATLADVTDAGVAAFLQAFAQAHSPATTNTRLAHLAAIANFAARQRFCEWLTVRRVREYKRVPIARTMDEVSQLIAYCDTLSGRFGSAPSGPAWKALFSTIYDTALRIGACLSIRQDDCDLHRRYILARAEKQKQKADQLLRISEATAEYLDAIWLPLRERIWEWHKSPRMFYHDLDKIVAGAGLPHGPRDKMHCLRRTSLSYMAQQHGRAAACDKAGHSCMAVTDRYLDPTIVGSPDTPPPLPVAARPTLKLFCG